MRLERLNAKLSRKYLGEALVLKEESEKGLDNRNRRLTMNI